MPRGNWLPHIATIGLIFLAGTPAYGRSNKSGNQSGVQVTQKAPKADTAPSSTAPIERDAKRIARALEEENAAQNSKANQNRAERNVEAQEKLAKWAPWMFGVGTAETVVTLVGVVLVGFTLRESKRSADAAQALLTSADRPHVVVEYIQVDPFDKGPEPERDSVRLAWRFINHGDDLAFLTGYSILTSIQPVGTLDDPPDMEIQKIYWPLAPKQAWGTPINAAKRKKVFTEDLRTEILDDKMAFYCMGSMNYNDPAGDSHSHRFVYIYRLSDKKFVPHPDDRYWSHT